MRTKYTIRDISTEIKSGLTPLRSKEEYWKNGNISWLKSEQLGVYKIYDTNEKITEFAIFDTSIPIIEPNSITLAMYGEGITRGKVSIIARRMSTNQACLNITVNENLADYRYIYYYLKGSYQRLRSLASGVRRNLNSGLVKGFEIYIPKIEEQKLVAEKVESFDKLVESNIKLISYLEEFSQLLFQKWFIDFNFPDKVGHPFKDYGGEMNEVSGKLIPNGWSINSFGENINIVTGKKDANYSTEDGAYTFLLVVKTN